MATLRGGSRFGGPVGPNGQDEPDADDMGGMSAGPPAPAPTQPAIPPFPQGRRRGMGRMKGLKKLFSPRRQRPNQFFGE